MVTRLEAGDWVELANNKIAKVHRAIQGGRMLMVQFEGDNVYSVVPLSEVRNKITKTGQRQAVRVVQFVNSGSMRSVVNPVIVSRQVQEKSYDALQARKILEALRCGVVPYGFSDVYTVGRDVEIGIIDGDLEAAKGTGAVRVFLGDYGTGKTHMLDCVEHRALQNNFLVARVTLDGGQVSPSQPRRVYHALVNNISYPDVPGSHGLRHLLAKACETLGSEWRTKGGSCFHTYLSPTLVYYDWLTKQEGNPEAEVCLEQMLDWIEGRSTISNIELNDDLHKLSHLRDQRLYALMDCQTWAHLYAYMLGGISSLAKAVGYSGLAILLDEAELYSVLTSSRKYFANLLFGYYSAAALGADAVLFDVNKSKRGGHKRHRDNPPIFKENQGIYCVFAMTPDQEGLNTLQLILPEVYFTELARLRVQDYQALVKKIIDIYCTVYPKYVFGSGVERPMGEIIFSAVKKGRFDSPRQILRLIVETLDYSRLCAEDIVPYVEELRMAAQD